MGVSPTSVPIVSIGVPSVSGSYDIGPLAQQQIMAVSLYILINGKFPGGATSWQIMDIFDNVRVFPTTTLWQQFASSVFDYLADIALGNPLPPTVTIDPNAVPPVSSGAVVPPPFSSGGIVSGGTLLHS